MNHMLNQMIESRSHAGESGRRGGLFFGTFAVALAILASGWTYSLFAKNVGLGTDEIEMSNLIAPVAIPAEAPPPPPPPMPRAEPNAPASPSKQVILRELVDEVAPTNNPPKDLTGQKDVVSATRFNPDDIKLGVANSIPADYAAGRSENGRTGGGGPCTDCGIGDRNGKKVDEPEEKEPVVKEKPTPEPPKKTVVSLGVANGKALDLIKPAYPASARTVRAQGSVSVQITIDEQGRVVSAAAVSGHPLLRNAAVDAARATRFTPTLLSNVPVKATGVIVYNFVL